jgi:hypothetical protein
VAEALSVGREIHNGGRMLVLVKFFPHVLLSVEATR